MVATSEIKFILIQCPMKNEQFHFSHITTDRISLVDVKLTECNVYIMDHYNDQIILTHEGN